MTAINELKNKIHTQDCLEFLKLLPDNSVDSCVTDPPYGLAFMGKEWDKLSTPKVMQEWHLEWATLVYEKLKPGAHILAFSGTRTYHRLACAIEDAGFEIRDQIHWLYGSGFPKGQNISKFIDKKLGFKGNPVDKSALPKRNQRKMHTDNRSGRFHRADGEHGHMEHTTTLPASVLAKQWQGWNTALKPAHEPIVVGRKPISEKSIADNVITHGTGALNIDVCRVALNTDVERKQMGRKTKRKERSTEKTREEWFHHSNEDNVYAGVLPSGRYPANLILSHHENCKLIQNGSTNVSGRKSERTEPRMGKYGVYGDEFTEVVTYQDYDSKSTPEIWNCVEGCPIKILNEQSGPTGAFAPVRGTEPSELTQGIYGGRERIVYGEREGYETHPYYGDHAGAARFFYCAKAPPSERNAGLGRNRNIHITVKPLAIMRWLVRLITPPNGTVLDPFLGSATTAIAAENEGFDWIGCDISEEFCEIAKLRLKALGGKQTRLAEFLEE